MASDQAESSIFNKEGPSYHKKLPNNTQGITRRVAMSAGFWSVLMYLQESIGKLDLIFFTRFSTQIFQDFCTWLIHQRAICESDQQNNSLIVIYVEMASKTAFICSDKSKHDNSSSWGIDNKSFDGASRHLAEYNIVWTFFDFEISGIYVATS